MAIERRLGQSINHPNPDPVERAEQIRLVWEMRRDGATFPLIAEKLNCSTSTAHKLFKEGLRMNAPPGAEEERILAVQQLDELYHQGIEALRQIIDPVDKLKALVVLDRLLKSRRELLGLDAPTKFQGHVAALTEHDLEIREMIQAFQMQAEQQEREQTDG